MGVRGDPGSSTQCAMSSSIRATQRRRRDNATTGSEYDHSSTILESFTGSSVATAVAHASAIEKARDELENGARRKNNHIPNVA